jgi:DNA-directed RNA polymerase specialized sigma24 family protein
MSSPTDQELIQYIGQGRREALAQLFDRYSADLYDYLARLVGDRDQAARGGL